MGKSSKIFSEMIRSDIEFYLRECNMDERERLIFDYKCQKVPNEEIAERLNCSTSTIDRAIRTLKNKISKCNQMMI